MNVNGLTPDWKISIRSSIAGSNFTASGRFIGGVAVDTKQDELFRTPGRFGWDGVLGTSAYVDPVKQVIGILFTQRMLDSAAPSYVITDFWTLAYGALES